MAQKEFTRKQGITIVVAVVATVGGLLWGGKQFLSRPPQAGPAVEMPAVQEQVVAGERVDAPQAARPGQMTDEQARRREALENLKYGATQSR